LCRVQSQEEEEEEEEEEVSGRPEMQMNRPKTGWMARKMIFSVIKMEKREDPGWPGAFC
jgi:hypothetical protein